MIKWEKMERRRGIIMFVSSYNTYLSTASTQTKRPQKKSEDFTLSKDKTTEAPLKKSETPTKLPLNYVSQFKVLSNQQKLQKQMQSSQKSKFTKVNIFKNAQSAYSDNATMFPLIKKPKVALGNIQYKLPTTTATKLNAVNTYIANDNYYKVTA
jgi:hypothetical protein